jgi:hypothetical protein
MISARQKTTQQHNNTTTQQHNNTTTQQHNNTTTQKHNNTTTQQHNNTTTQKPRRRCCHCEEAAQAASNVATMAPPSSLLSSGVVDGCAVGE